MSEIQATLSARSRAMLKQAEKEAEDLRHRFVEPEHLLLALLKDEDTIAAVTLSKLGVQYEPMLEQVRKARIVPNTTGSVSRGASRRTRVVLKAATDEAKAMGKEWIETEHVLLDLPQEPAMREGVLRTLRINQNNVRTQVHSALGLPPPTPENKPLPPAATAVFDNYVDELESQRRKPSLPVIRDLPHPTEIDLGLDQKIGKSSGSYTSLKPVYIFLLFLLLLGLAFGFGRYVGLATFGSLGLLGLIFMAWYFGRRR
jgi:hypothetical protein